MLHYLSQLNESVDGVNVNKLKLYALSRHGLIDKEIRRKLWPLLMDDSCSKIDDCSDEEISDHPEYRQVCFCWFSVFIYKLFSGFNFCQILLDVQRSQSRFPPGMEEVERKSKQCSLIRTIIRVLIAKPHLHYYQGFHDVCVTFLLVLDENEAVGLITQLCESHFMFAFFAQFSSK